MKSIILVFCAINTPISAINVLKLIDSLVSYVHIFHMHDSARKLHPCFSFSHTYTPSYARISVHLQNELELGKE
jgi:hypothetical protein